jgi:hypothetical protein
MTYHGDIGALLERAERFAVAQENYAAQANEDSQHWHHVALANLLRELASALSSHNGATP